MILVRKSFYWLSGGTVPLPVSYISDTAAPVPGWALLSLPTWLPRSVQIIRVQGGYGCSLYPNAGAVEFQCYVDPQGIYYTSGHGTEGGDFSRTISLAHSFDYKAPYEKLVDSGELSVPAVLNRDLRTPGDNLGDKLILMVANSPALDWAYLNIHFQIDASVVIPGY